MMPGNLNEMLKGLRTSIETIASAIVSRDGILLASDVPPGVYTETFAIMCATILGAAVTANSELKKGIPERIVIEGKDSKTIIIGAGKKSLIVAVVSPQVEMQKVITELSKISENIK